MMNRTVLLALLIAGCANAGPMSDVYSVTWSGSDIPADCAEPLHASEILIAPCEGSTCHGELWATWLLGSAHNDEFPEGANDAADGGLALQGVIVLCGEQQAATLAGSGDGFAGLVPFEISGSAVSYGVAIVRDDDASVP